MLAGPAAAQQGPNDGSGTGAGSDKPAAAAPVEKTAEEKAADEARKSWVEGRPMTIQYLRPATSAG